VKLFLLERLTIVALPVVVDVATTVTLMESPGWHHVHVESKSVSGPGNHSYHAEGRGCD
jgi:hypothetical protein